MFDMFKGRKNKNFTQIPLRREKSWWCFRTLSLSVSFSILVLFHNMLRGGQVAMLLRRVFIKFDVRPLFVQPSLLPTMSLSLCYWHKRHHQHLNLHFGSSAVCLWSWFQRWVSTTASGTHKCSSEKTHSKMEIYRFDNDNNKIALNATLTPATCSA